MLVNLKGKHIDYKGLQFQRWHQKEESEKIGLFSLVI